MTEETDLSERVDRRNYLRYGGAVALGGLLAGCTGGGPSDSGGSQPSTTDDGSSADGDGDGSDGDASGDETAPYEACIEPVGCLTFESVPETYAVYNGGWADMAFALGQQDGFLTAGNMIPSFFFEPFDLDVPSQDELPSMWGDGGWDKESFYELDPDVFLIDPNYLHGTGWDSSWSEADTAEIRENVAPFFGNNMRRRRGFHDYELYGLYEGFERLADLFQERERYEALAAVHEELQTEIASRLPPEEERPKVGLINGGSNPASGEIYPLYTRGEGYEMKPYRDLEVKSAFSEELSESGAIGYERLLEVDPEIIVVHWGIGTTGDTDSYSASAFREQYVTPMEEDEVGSELTAVSEGRVYPGAYGEQGPIVNLLQTEMKAQQLYPEEFGQFDPEAFPEVPEENRLFDRDRVNDIIAGDL
ncbi:ABC transporter substrate-binding protein [Halorubrum sp. SS5]|nr:ABC transporter substrate-binding protein [Halorubrum sp. SS5]